MPEPDLNVEDDPIEVDGSRPAPTLDEVHQLNQAKVDFEDEQLEGEEDDDDASGADDADDDAGNGGDDDDAGSGDDEDEDDAGSGDDEDEDDAGTPAPVTPPAPVVEPTTELDTDITKNGANKVAIKDADGNTLYFNNLDEVPEDFEPASYKALMDGTRALLKKEDADAKVAAEAEAKANEEAHTQATNDLVASWDKDAADLTSSGLLPKGDKNEAAKQEVFDYIDAEFQKGNVITSFKQAYKSMMYDREVDAKATRQKELNDAKKRRGGVVQGSNGGSDGSSSTRSNKVIEAPPTGVGLDAVHRRALDSL